MQSVAAPSSGPAPTLLQLSKHDANRCISLLSILITMGLACCQPQPRSFVTQEQRQWREDLDNVARVIAQSLATEASRTILFDRNLPTTLKHFTNQFSDPSFLAPSPSAGTSAPSTGLTARGRLIQTSAESSAARGGPATKRSGRAA